MGFLSNNQLMAMGFKQIGTNVLISDKCSIYGAENIQINDNVRIDDFCIISASPEGIIIGKYVHIAAYCSLIGKAQIELEDFSGLSSRVSIYSSSDDYSGSAMTNPCVPEQFTNVHSAPVNIQKHVIVGVGSAILPGVTIGYGSAIGAFSLVSKNVEPMIIASGAPLKILKKRKNLFQTLEYELLKSLNS